MSAHIVLKFASLHDGILAFDLLCCLLRLQLGCSDHHKQFTLIVTLFGSIALHWIIIIERLECQLVPWILNFFYPPPPDWKMGSTVRTGEESTKLFMIKTKNMVEWLWHNSVTRDWLSSIKPSKQVCLYHLCSSNNCCCVFFFPSFLLEQLTWYIWGVNNRKTNIFLRSLWTL